MGHTVVVIDLAHHGTTMLSGVLEMLGIPMVGDHFDKKRWEDLEIREALDGGGDAFGAVVEKRNAAHDTWGFKRCGVWKQASFLDVRLRDPVYLAIYKDPISVTRRRFGTSNDRRLLGKVRSTIRQMHESINGICAAKIPVTMFSYHQALMLPGVFIRRVGATIGIEPTWEQVARIGQYIQPNVTGPRKPYPLVQEYL